MKWRYRGRRKPLSDDVSDRAKAVRQAPRDWRSKNLRDWCKKMNHLECGLHGNPADDPWEVDHIRPIVRGGKEEYANLRIIRRSKNRLWKEKDRSEQEIEIALRINAYQQNGMQ